MIETYKILHGIYDAAVLPDLPICQDSFTRGNYLRTSLDYDMRKYFFTEKIINVWNSLPSYIVNSSSVNSFKNNLDKFRSNQEVYYNFKCDINGTINRSVCVRID